MRFAGDVRATAAGAAFAQWCVLCGKALACGAWSAHRQLLRRILPGLCDRVWPEEEKTINCQLKDAADSAGTANECG
eukprot:scaffold17390_cov104-Isochrysis_galbana.AAC.8